MLSLPNSWIKSTSNSSTVDCSCCSNSTSFTSKSSDDFMPLPIDRKVNDVGNRVSSQSSSTCTCSRGRGTRTSGDADLVVDDRLCSVLAIPPLDTCGLQLFDGANWFKP